MGNYCRDRRSFVGIVTFLSYYDTIRNKGKLFVCDIAKFFGIKDSIPSAPTVKNSRTKIWPIGIPRQK